MNTTRPIVAVLFAERTFTGDEMLDNITLNWLTNTGTSSARIYWETANGNTNLGGISVPVAVTIFPGEVYKPPRSWVARAYSNLIYYNRVDQGGDAAALKQSD